MRGNLCMKTVTHPFETCVSCLPSNFVSASHSRCTWSSPNLFFKVLSLSRTATWHRVLSDKEAQCSSASRCLANVDDLNFTINKMDIADLQSVFEEYVKNQTSSDKVATFFYGSQCLLDIIGTDCAKYIFGFLNDVELSKISRTSKAINELTQEVKQHILPLSLPGHWEWGSMSKGIDTGHVLIGYTLKHTYDAQKWNSMSFIEFEREGLLRGQDRDVWRMCNQYNLETIKVVGFEPEDGEVYFMEGAVEDRIVSEAELHELECMQREWDYFYWRMG